MSADTYEVAFSGEIAEGADLEKVKANVAQMFKADAAKLAHLFSGKRVVIKKGIDQQTAMKYQAALTKAGAVCEVANLTTDSEIVESVSAVAVETKSAPAESAVSRPVVSQDVKQEHSGDVPAAPQTVPLDITGDQIQDLSASLAPVGSDVQDPKAEVPELQVDLSGMDMAPVGTDLGNHKEKPVPPPPDISGLSLEDS